MQSGPIRFPDCGIQASVQLAQACGFAEADPVSDLSGADAAAKLAILVRHATAARSLPPGFVHQSGIDEATGERTRANRGLGNRLRLLATYRACGSEARSEVGLAELAADDWLSGCAGEENRLEIEHSNCEVVRVSGRGAGRWPTTLAVMADIYDAWREWLDTDVGNMA